jgi:MFS family permease
MGHTPTIYGEQNMSKGLLSTFSGFPKVFWVSQTFELMERGAYYSMMPIIVVHAIYNVGLPIWLGATITVFMYPFQYGLPIFTGALAEKVGYKRQIILAFSILTAAYVFLAFAFNTVTMIFAVMAVGMGIGTYKPLISSTVAKCTPDKDRNRAYSVYYWIVNFAAFVIPLSFAAIIFFGVITQEMFYVIFLAGAGFVSINILTAILIFEEVPRSGKVKTVGDAINNIKIAMRDKKFVVMVMLIGGFWGLYSTFLNALPLIMFGFDRLPVGFSIMLLGVFNPMTIILLGIPLTKFIEKVESMRVILTGLVIYLIGMAIIGFTLQWMVVIFGIIVVSVGEFIIAPGYMAFVSKLAPKEKVSAYVGCNFISYLIGLLGGTFVFGLIVSYVGTELQMPHFFYGIIISIGLGLLIAFIIYYWTWGQDIIERAKRIRELEEGVSDETEIPTDYKEPFIFQLFENKLSVIICAALIPVVLFSTFSMGTLEFQDPFEEDEDDRKLTDWSQYEIMTGDQVTLSGALQENSETVETIPVDENNVLSITFILTWTDEPDQQYGPRTYVNEPDSFTLEVQAPDGSESRDTAMNPQGGTGEIFITMEYDPDIDPYLNGTGTYNVTIQLGECGDFFSNGPIGFTDTENDWELAVEYEYYFKE